MMLAISSRNSSACSGAEVEWAALFQQRGDGRWDFQKQ